MRVIERLTRRVMVSKSSQKPSISYSQRTRSNPAHAVGKVANSILVTYTEGEELEHGEDFGMRVLVVGQGGREHALAWKLRQSPQVTRVYCAPGNAGTEADAVNVDLPATDIERLVKFAREEQVGLAVIGPEAPLALGMADAMSAAGIRVFGPSKAAARWR